MIRPWRIFKDLRKTSEAVFGDKNRLFKLIKESGVKALTVDSFESIRDELKVLFQLLKDYKNGEYREISKTTILMIVSALIYLINPLDLVPDFILGIGFLDDLTVFGYLLKKIKTELDKYKTWKGL